MSSTTTPGLNLPTMKAMPAGNPRDSAIATQQMANTKLANLNKSVGGRRRTRRHRKSKRGGADATTAKITVPQFQMLYPTQGGPGQNPNDIIKQNSVVSTQGAANSVYDKYATQKGGYVYGMNKKSRKQKLSRRSSRRSKSSRSRSRKSVNSYLSSSKIVGGRRRKYKSRKSRK